MSEKINLNGKIIDANQAIFTADNRAFKYGDSLFETIRVFNGRIPFLSYHLDRLKKGMDILGMNDSNDFLHHILPEINQLIQAKGNWRIRLTVFRNDGGLYTPKSNKIQFLIKSQALDSASFQLNENGLILGISKEKLLSANLISAIKTGNSLPYILAAIERNKNNWDDILIRNNKGEIAEALSSNLFLISGNKIITPPLESGCVAGTIRAHLLEKKTVPIKEQKITLKKLQEAEAAFVTNAIQGIKWVGEIEGIVLSKWNIIDGLVEELNAYVNSSFS